MLVGGLSRGVRGGQTRRPVGSGVSHLLTCYTTWATVYIIFLLGSEITFTSPGPWPLNPFWETGRRALDALATSDPSVTREAQGGRVHAVSGDGAVQRDHAALS